jgi:hypothetical protein
MREEPMEARRTQIDRWYQRSHSGRGTTQYAEAKAQSYHSRAAARFERYRVELVSPDSDMTTLAEAAVVSLGDIHKAESKEDMEQRAEHTRNLIEQFVAAGAGTWLLTQPCLNAGRSGLSRRKDASTWVALERADHDRDRGTAGMRCDGLTFVRRWGSSAA